MPMRIRRFGEGANLLDGEPKLAVSGKRGEARQSLPIGASEDIDGPNLVTDRFFL